MVISSALRNILDKWPGKRLGIYRFLPIFFALGAALEFSMINWHAGEVNFYRVYKRNKSHELALEQLRGEESKKKLERPLE